MPSPAAVLPEPLMLITRSAPFASTAIPDGNQPVGNAPATFHCPASARTMAIALLPPQATYKVPPSGANATATGWLPSVPSGQVSILTSPARSVFVSTSEMESECPLATAASFPSGLSAIPEGASPTGRCRVEKSFASITLIVPEIDEPVTESVAINDPLLG